MKIVSSGVGSEFHALYLTDARTVFHCFRVEGGAWQKWLPLLCSPLADVTCAGVADTLHVFGITETGICIHAIRMADGSWTDFQQLPDQSMITE